MSTILITGVAGFIGSNLAEELIKHNHKVIGVDNFSTGKKENIANLNKLDLHTVDITNFPKLKKTMNGVDYVLHHAAMPSVPYSVDHPVETTNVNVQGTFNVLLAAKEMGVKKVIFASSAAVYGETDSMQISENHKLDPLSPYAAHKIVGEYYCRLFYNVYGLRTTSLRYFNVFGPRQDPNSTYAAVIPKFLSLIKSGKNPIIYGDGLQTRDFICVKDIVRANVLALNNTVSDGKEYNIASGKKTSVLDLVKYIGHTLKANVKPIFESVRVGDIKHSVAKVTKAKNDLDFETSYDLERGLKLLI